MDEAVTEAMYRVHVVTAPANVAAARDLLFLELERANYPIREIETLSEGDGPVELAAILVPTTADPDELDTIVGELKKDRKIDSAT